jgi:hypothetical protein
MHPEPQRFIIFLNYGTVLDYGATIPELLLVLIAASYVRST